jgi:hypothetical protein
MPEISVTVETSPAPSLSFWSSSLPPQTGNAGKLLGTNGASASWTNEPTFKSAKVQDATVPLFELRCTTAPTDKKFVRWSADATGAVNIERVNDAYTVATRLIYWDASNNTSLAGGDLNVNGSIRNIAGSILGAADAGAWTLGAGSSTPGTAGSGAFVQLYGGGHPTWAGRTFFGSSAQTFGAVDPNGNWGFGTLLPGARVHVVGGDFLLENNRKFAMADASGSAPYITCQSDNNLALYSTTNFGAARGICDVLARSDSSALRVLVPLKIGANGANIHSVLKATVTHAIGTITAGGFLELTSTVTGAIAGAMVHVGSGAPNNLILRGYVSTGDTVSVMYHNPTAAPINAGTRSIDLFVFNA